MFRADDADCIGRCELGGDDHRGFFCIRRRGRDASFSRSFHAIARSQRNGDFGYGAASTGYVGASAGLARRGQTANAGGILAYHRSDGRPRSCESGAARWDATQGGRPYGRVHRGEEVIETVIVALLLGMLGITALAILRAPGLFTAAMLSGIYSLLSAVIFVTLDAVDVAFTEAVVGAGVSTILMLAALALTHERRARPTPTSWTGLAAVSITGGALIYATVDMPLLGDPLAPANLHVAPRYLLESGAEIGVPNVVTSVLASYRGFDTFGEVTVIFTAGIGVLALLGRGRRQPPSTQDS